MDKCPTCGAPARHSAPDGDFKYAPTPAQAEAQAPTTAVLTEDDVDAIFASSGSIGQFLIALKARLTVGAPAPTPTKFVAVNSAQDIDDVIADIMKPAKGYTP